MDTADRIHFHYSNVQVSFVAQIIQEAIDTETAELKTEIEQLKIAATPLPFRGD